MVAVSYLNDVDWHVGGEQGKAWHAAGDGGCAACVSQEMGWGTKRGSGNWCDPWRARGPGGHRGPSWKEIVEELQETKWKDILRAEQLIIGMYILNTIVFEVL